MCIRDRVSNMEMDDKTGGTADGTIETRNEKKETVPKNYSKHDEKPKSVYENGSKETSVENMDANEKVVAELSTLEKSDVDERSVMPQVSQFQKANFDECLSHGSDRNFMSDKLQINFNQETELKHRNKGKKVGNQDVEEACGVDEDWMRSEGGWKHIPFCLGLLIFALGVIHFNYA